MKNWRRQWLYEQTHKHIPFVPSFISPLLRGKEGSYFRVPFHQDQFGKYHVQPFWRVSRRKFNRNAERYLAKRGLLKKQSINASIANKIHQAFFGKGD